MVIGRHADGTIVVMASDRGLSVPAMRSPDGEWRVDAPTADELREFSHIEDEGERERLLKEARAHLDNDAARVEPVVAAGGASS